MSSETTAEQCVRNGFSKDDGENMPSSPVECSSIVDTGNTFGNTCHVHYVYCISANNEWPLHEICNNYNKYMQSKRC